uniref:Uncharacterized protein n=1 Tax=viral metagenome TaxID=1070528 RepID=A0A6M3KD98_9ZZZZ
MENEQYYLFVDKSGHCFEDFQDMKAADDGHARYNDHVGAMLRASHHDGFTFCVGDMMAFKQDLLDAGFKWGIDFYVKKVDKD